MIILDFNMVISTMCNPGIMVYAANWIFTVDTVYQMKSVQVTLLNKTIFLLAMICSEMVYHKIKCSCQNLKYENVEMQSSMLYSKE